MSVPVSGRVAAPIARLRWSRPGWRRLSLVLAVLVALALGLPPVLRDTPDTTVGPPPPHTFNGSLSTDGILASCQDNPDPSACYVHGLDHYMRVYGVEPTLALFGQLAERSPTVKAGGHNYTHQIGRLAYLMLADPRRAMSFCDDSYQSGCYHGVLEAYLGNKTEVTAADLVNLCEPIDGQPQSLFRRHQCVHGMGHGLVIYTARDIFPALEYCDALRTDWDRSSCYTGVFMENFIPVGPGAVVHNHNLNKPQKEPAYKKDDLQYPCNAVAAKYVWACYFLQTSLILRLNGMDVAGMFWACDQAPALYIRTCYQSGGRDVSSLANYDIDASLNLCRLGNPTRWGDCYTGALKNLTWDNEAPGYTICARVESEWVAQCAEALGEVISSLYTDPAVIAERCDRLNGVAAHFCRRGARLA